MSNCPTLQAISGISLPVGSDKLYSGSADGSVRVWDCNSGKVAGLSALGTPFRLFTHDSSWVNSSWGLHLRRFLRWLWRSLKCFHEINWGVLSDCFLWSDILVPNQFFLCKIGVIGMPDRIVTGIFSPACVLLISISGSVCEQGNEAGLADKQGALWNYITVLSGWWSIHGFVKKKSSEKKKEKVKKKGKKRCEMIDDYIFLEREDWTRRKR